jgi:IS5 family transposase
MQQFVGINLGREPVPDETTICKFSISRRCTSWETALTRIGSYLAEWVSRGTIVDATILSVPSSTKNRTKERNPKMYQTKSALSKG